MIFVTKKKDDRNILILQIRTMSFYVKMPGIAVTELVHLTAVKETTIHFLKTSLLPLLRTSVRRFSAHREVRTEHLLPPRHERNLCLIHSLTHRRSKVENGWILR